MKFPPNYDGKHFRFAWAYKSLSGSTLGFAVRYENDVSGKVVIPFFKESKGTFLPGGPSGKPLYGIEGLRNLTSDSMIYIHEGERCACAGNYIDLPSVTWLGGCQQAAQTDLSPLANFVNFTLIADNDPNGLTAMMTIKFRLLMLCPSARTQIVQFRKLPNKSDLVDVIHDLLPTWNGFDPINTADVASLKKAVENVIIENIIADQKQHKWLPYQLPQEKLADVDSFELSMLPEAFKDFVEDVADRMQCPVDFIGASMMVFAAGVIGKQCTIKPKRRDDWEVVPNLWGAAVGRPGVMKSPAIAEARKFVNRLEIKEKELYNERVVNSSKDRELLKIKKSIKRAKLKEEAKKKDACIEELYAKFQKDDQASEPAVEPRRRYIVNDATVEKLGELLVDSPNGLILFRDELVGWLKGLDKIGRETERAFMLESWDGASRFVYDRIIRGTIEIEACCLSIFGGIQPGPLSAYQAEANKNGSGDDGLIQRFQILVWPDISLPWKNVDRYPNKEAKDRAWSCFIDLANLPKINGEISSFQFTNDAQELFDTWRIGFEKDLRSNKYSAAFESHISKYRSLVPALALIIERCDQPFSIAITSKSLQKAIRWSTYLRTHAMRLYSHNSDYVTRSAIEIVRRIQSGTLGKCDLLNGFSCREIYRNAWSNLKDVEIVEAALELLVELNCLRGFARQGIGREAYLYAVHPDLIPA